jgi:cysteine synthase A
LCDDEGGTLAGVSAFLKAVHPSVKCILADPHASSLFRFVKSGGKSSEASEGATMMEGIGINRITANFSEAQVVMSHVVCALVSYSL